MSVRRVCAVTGTRAEFGLLRYVLEGLRDRACFDLRLLVTGSHLSPEFGMTVREIETAGFVPSERIEMLLSSDTPVAIAKSLGLATIGFAEALARHAPDLLLVLGDRYEILAAAQAALLARVPVAHVQGGEITEGAVDDAIRHAITKLSHVHFAAAEPYRARILQLGEAPELTFNVGALGVDAIERLAPVPRDELERELGIELESPLLLITYHPPTLDETEPVQGFRALLTALDAFPRARVVITLGNADAGGRALHECAVAYARATPERVVARPSLGHRQYLSVLRHCSAVIGNSSSGIIEAPALRVPTINVGSRQAGRLRAGSIVDVPAEADAIRAALAQVLDPELRGSRAGGDLPYGSGGAAERILDVLAKVPLDGIVQKRFRDLRPGVRVD
jgi:UDP-hydrolysing UDP-N-acetyl-D-glucosamine 2-epimerase